VLQDTTTTVVVVVVVCLAKVPQHGGALKVAGVVVGNWKSSGDELSYVKVVDHLTARSAPLQPPPMTAAITSVLVVVGVVVVVVIVVV